MRDLVVPFFSPKVAMHHYLSMARHNYREHMRDGRSPKVKLKKYLYITRPLLCCRWIERDPTAGLHRCFLNAINAANISPELCAAIDDLAECKKAAEEIDEGAAVPIINQVIDTELARLPAAVFATSTPFSTTFGRRCSTNRPDPLTLSNPQRQSFRTSKRQA